ncbi:hypothetical protein ZIOFF_051726 [Zingiber officinale]|uniref:Pectinesterase inhibitor domain-containing protein n=1 Tax=Zingiber officinale TaxID=94328 RepID=A0A8J5FT93_ZINOF|nr:hypothetical protein ZIOFF_051726 [Zingiber officinale]
MFMELFHQKSTYIIKIHKFCKHRRRSKSHVHHSSSHIIPIPEPPCNSEEFFDVSQCLYYDATWNSMISSEDMDGDPIEPPPVEEKNRGRNEKDNDNEGGNEIDRLAEKFIASCHEKFRLEKQESYRRSYPLLNSIQNPLFEAVNSEGNQRDKGNGLIPRIQDSLFFCSFVSAIFIPIVFLHAFSTSKWKLWQELVGSIALGQESPTLITNSSTTMTRFLAVADLLLAAIAASSCPGHVTTDVANAGKYVTMPQLCTNLIFKSGATTLGDLTKAAIEDSLEKAEEVGKTTASTMAAPTAGEILKRNLGVCKDAFESAVVNLQETKQKKGEAISKGKAHTEVTDAISAALVSVGSANPGVVSLVADATGILKKLMSNSLSVAVEFQVKNGAS